MLRRKKDLELPITSQSSSLNGSGKSIHTDAPIIRSIKQTSSCTKFSYILLLFSIFMILYGWRAVMTNRAHLSLTCHMESCALEIGGSNLPKTYHVLIPRKQIIRTDYVKLDDAGNEIVEVLQGSYRPKTGHQAKKSTKYFDSYTLVLKNEIDDGDDYNDNNMKEHIDKHTKHIQKSLILYNKLSSSELKTIGIVTQNNTINSSSSSSSPGDNNNDNEHTYIMRRYWVSNRAWVNYNRLKSYIQGKRNKVVIREYKPPSVFGILLIVFGIFFMIFCLILGQFIDDSDFYSSGKSRENVVARRKRMESQRQRKALYSSSSSARGKVSVVSRKRYD